MNGWYALLAFVVGWLVAQIWKTLAGIWNKRKNREDVSFLEVARCFSKSGGMPSGHSASMTALTTVIGMMAGFDSGLFALSLAVTLIVIYDATHVRYAVGVQGKALNELLQKDGKLPLKVVEGHTLAQVVVGVIIGLVTGVVIGFIFKA